ncbi:OmpA family protein [Rhizobium sp. CB3171]|uniref:OmpA family protein n=1 Tax=Rhizobium sp. CB3171 TaxID=3039157 RepID=UPI0024B19DC6|nr:OmpA family protein [Rhizobium sp. CB3171]WFU03665.1 OmpA family protein [Rhizobium sp. CB3171]
MGKRSRLFASAAFPLLSLSLAFEPAAATALRDQAIAPLSNAAAGSVAVNGNASFEVAQEQPAPDGQSEEELKKRKKPGGAEQGEPQGQKHEAAPAQQGGAEPQRKMKEAQPEGQPEQQKPAKQQQETQQPKALQPQAVPETQQAQPEQKKHKQNAEQQPAAQPEVAPQPKAAQQQAAPETQPQGQPELKKRQKKQDQSAEPAQQPAEQKAAPAQQQAPAAQPTQSGQAQPETPAQPEKKKHQKLQGQSAEPAQQPAEQKVAPAQQPAEQKVAPALQQAPATEQAQPKTQVQPGNQVEPGTQQGQKPATGKLPQTEQGAQQPAATPEQKPVQKNLGQQAQPQNEVAPQVGKQQQPNVETGAPAQGNAVQAPANGAVQQGAQTAAPAAGGEQVSPQELERRKKIAANPAASNETVILPVQNGAAVLDSDKDAARRGFRQGGQAAGGQAQTGAGQAQTGQSQSAPVQQPQAYAKAPTSDAEAQRALAGQQQQQPVRIEAITSEQGRRLDRRPDFASPEGVALQPNGNQGGRVILNIDNTYVVRHDDSARFIREGERPIYEQLPRDRYRETIDQPDGDRIITVRNRYGDVIQRSRIDARGREYVLFYSPELEDQPDRDDYFRDPGDELPPMRLRIPLNQYIIDTGTDREADYYDFLREPPVEPVERVYSLNEVRYSARIRDKVRRIDLDTITFATGSAEIPMSQASTLRGVADAMGKIVKKDPTETFMIEGHTDAVGTPESNLVLSDQRAESVAKVLSDVYGIPPENLVTQGYGEQYLKVNTQGPEQENRRVTIRRVTALVRPVASTQ